MFEWFRRLDLFCDLELGQTEFEKVVFAAVPTATVVASVHPFGAEEEEQGSFELVVATAPAVSPFVFVSRVVSQMHHPLDFPVCSALPFEDV